MSPSGAGVEGRWRASRHGDVARRLQRHVDGCAAPITLIQVLMVIRDPAIASRAGRAVAAGRGAP